MDNIENKKQLVEQLREATKSLEVSIAEDEAAITKEAVNVHGGVASFFQSDFKWKFGLNPHPSHPDDYALQAIPVTEAAERYYKWLLGAEPPVETFDIIREELQYHSLFRYDTPSVLYFDLGSGHTTVLSNLAHLRDKMPDLKIEFDQAAYESEIQRVAEKRSTEITRLEEAVHKAEDNLKLQKGRLKAEEEFLGCVFRLKKEEDE